MTGPIVFSDETARTQLVEEGIVVTFRASRRTVGSTWWRESRTGEKEGDCVVELVRHVPKDQLESALLNEVDRSGFASVYDWLDAINELNGGRSDGYLYRVTTEASDE